MFWKFKWYVIYIIYSTYKICKYLDLKFWNWVKNRVLNFQNKNYLYSSNLCSITIGNKEDHWQTRICNFMQYSSVLYFPNLYIKFGLRDVTARKQPTILFKEMLHLIRAHIKSYLWCYVIRCTTKCLGCFVSHNPFLAHSKVSYFDMTILIQ